MVYRARVDSDLEFDFDAARVVKEVRNGIELSRATVDSFLIYRGHW